MTPFGSIFSFWVNKTSIARTTSKGDIMSIKEIENKMESALDDGDFSRAGFYAAMLIDAQDDDMLIAA